MNFVYERRAGVDLHEWNIVVYAIIPGTKGQQHTSRVVIQEPRGICTSRRELRVTNIRISF